MGHVCLQGRVEGLAKTLLTRQCGDALSQYPKVMALGVRLLHPFQGVDTMLVTIDFYWYGLWGECVGSLGLSMVS